MKTQKKDRKGQGLVEYALIIALVALVCIVAMTAISGTLQDSFYTNIQTGLDNVSTNWKSTP